MPLKLLKRSSSPEDGMKWQVNAEAFEVQVEMWREKIREISFFRL